MKQLPVLTFFALLLGLPSVSSCKKESLLINKPPVANAGDDQTLYWQGMDQQVSLDGSASFDPEGAITRFLWTKLTANDFLPAKIDDPNSAKTFVTPLNPGQHKFSLQVIDNKGKAARDEVTINVIDTVTTSGKEYLFENLTWFDDNDYWFINYIQIPSRLLFYKAGNMEVSMLLANVTSWQTVQPWSQSTPNGTFNYLAGGGVLQIQRVVLQSSDNLTGTKVSVIVKFL